MNKFRYILAAALVGLVMTACDDDDNKVGMLDGLGMVNRSVSLEEGTTVRATAIDKITLDYNNLVGINPDVPVTLNGQPVAATVNPDNRMQLVIPVSLDPYVDYCLEIPEGAVYRSDNMSVAAEAFTLNFNTNAGMNPTLAAPALVNPSASPEAKKVYEFLRENYGKKQLSGAMGEVAWGTAFSDFVAEEAGKYPAIVGFDYIHLAYSPANWINYGDITPVQNVWNAGSIPAVCWHWNVDHEVFNGESVMPADWSGNVQLTTDGLGELPVVFGELQKGSVITVKIKDVKPGAQGSVKGSDWNALGYGLDYFEISGDEYSVEISTDEMLKKVQTSGFIISGHDYTVTSVLVGKTCRESVGKGFLASNALIPGTRENEVVKADVAKLAGYLQLLRDANIPVLFRPFHEAAGDHTWGYWFWWGNSGVDTTKELWKWLYKTLTEDYGLNNLIWVWTMNVVSENNLADISYLRNEYPGDEYVDIVGTDIYEAAMSDQTPRFDLIYNAIGGSKIIALTETGNMLDPTAQKQDIALWSYFMTWYELDNGKPAHIEYNANGEIPVVFNNPLVLNRGDFSVK